MYAIIESGGKQHRVAPGDVVAVERLDGEPGAKVKLDKVLLVTTDQGTEIGQPLVDGAVVQATVVSQDRGRKILIFKKKRRKKFRRRQGHRQSITRLMIDRIDAKGVKGEAAQAEAPKAAAKPAAKKPKAAPKPAPKKTATQAEAAGGGEGEAPAAEATA
jgi:large subunit ribosomal protein L21